MKKYARRILATAAFLAALRLCPGLARFALECLSLPAMALLHRLTAPVPFPVAEPLGLGLLAMPLAGLMHGGSGRWEGLGKTALALLVALALLWGPALAVPAGDVPAPDAAALARLCGALIDRLSAAPLAFPDAAGSLALAPSVAGQPGLRVKAPALPGWMALAGAWGVFVPLTGEALVDAAAPAPLIPFTAVHELMHLRGIADEGAANIAAWQRCLAAGGPFADSAALWALRYAMGRLRQTDPAAWQAMRAKMEGALKRTFLDCGGEADPPGDYAALAGYLAEENH